MKLFGIRIARIETLESEKQAAVEDHKHRTAAEAAKIFRDEGYVEWICSSPPRDKQFLLIRAGWYWPHETNAIDISPYMNTVGAFWKLCDDKVAIASLRSGMIN